MKKLFFAAALLLGIGGTTAFAVDMQASQAQISVVNADEYKTIDAKELPQAIQDVIAKDYSKLTIKEAAVAEKEGVKTYRVTFTGENDTTTVVLFNEKGEVVK